jgi:hypothetical protein
VLRNRPWNAGALSDIYAATQLSQLGKWRVGAGDSASEPIDVQVFYTSHRLAAISSAKEVAFCHSP